MLGKVCIRLLCCTILVVAIQGAPYPQSTKSENSSERSGTEKEGNDEADIKKLVNNGKDSKSMDVLRSQAKVPDPHDVKQEESTPDENLGLLAAKNKVNLLNSAFSPRQIASIILSSRDYEGFLDVMRRLEKSNVVSAEEIALYKANVALEMEKLFFEAETGARILLMESEALNQPNSTASEASVPNTQTSEQGKKKRKSQTKSSVEKQEAGSSTTTSPATGTTQNDDVLPEQKYGTRIAKFIRNLGIQDDIINSLLYDWMTEEANEGKKLIELGLDGFLQYLRRKGEDARRNGQFQIARATGHLADAILAEYSRRIMPVRSHTPSEREFKMPKESGVNFNPWGKVHDNRPENRPAQGKTDQPGTIEEDSNNQEFTETPQLSETGSAAKTREDNK